jgi:hypothetical protein
MFPTTRPMPPLPALPDLDGASCTGSQLFDGDETHLELLRRVCARCPVRHACLDVALQTHPAFAQGIWAGTTDEDRAVIRRALGISFVDWTNPKLMHELTHEPVTRRRCLPDREPTAKELAEIELQEWPAAA